MHVVRVDKVVFDVDVKLGRGGTPPSFFYDSPVFLCSYCGHNVGVGG